MPLKPCIKSTADLNDDDVASVLDSFQDYVEAGLSQTKAAESAVDDVIATVESERKEWLDLIKEQHPKEKVVEEKPVEKKPVENKVVIPGYEQFGPREIDKKATYNGHEFIQVSTEQNQHVILYKNADGDYEILETGRLFKTILPRLAKSVELKTKEQKPVAEPVELADTEDVGAELSYNRRQRGLSLADIEAATNDTERLTLAQKKKLWERPDYQEMVDGGIQPVIAHTVKQIYDSLANKPRNKTEDGVYAYVKGIEASRQAVDEFLADRNAQVSVISVIAAQAARRVKGSFSITDLIDEDKGALDYILDRVFPKNEDGYRWGRGNQEGNTRALALGKAYKNMSFTLDNYVKAMKAIEEGWPGKTEAWQRSYKILPKAKVIEVNEYKGQYRVIRSWTILDRFDTQEQADAYAGKLPEWYLMRKKGGFVESYDSQQAALDAVRELTKRTHKEQFKEPAIPVEKSMREGEDFRKGENVSTQDLLDVGGFRGINFGNWMKGSGANAKERQAHTNSIYDSVHDLAELMDVPVNAISLDGMLGIAVGAQGRGKYAAHFVPGLNEINITRGAGAGSLAHEWAHALDHYFGVLAGFSTSDDPFLSQHRRISKDAGIRPEIVEHFNTIYDAMTKIEKDFTAKEIEEFRKQAMESDSKQLGRWLESVQPKIEGEYKPSKKFTDLVNSIKAGDIGEYVKLGKSQNYVGANINALREEYKVITGRYFSLDAGKGINFYGKGIARYADSEAYFENHPKTKTVRTDYYRSAIGKESKSGKPYWATPWEMFARAFESYVLDKLETESRRNDYLTAAWKGDKEGVFSEEASKWFPQGIERESINNAFDALITELKTRETDKGVALFSRRSYKGGAAKPAGISAQAAREVISEFTGPFKNELNIQFRVYRDKKSAFGEEYAKKHEKDLIRGAYYPKSRKVALIASDLANKSDAMMTLRHEIIGHHGLNLFPADVKQGILDAVSASRQVSSLKNIWNKVDKDYAAFDETKRAEEVIARIAESKQGRFTKAWAAIVTAIRKAMRAIGLIDNTVTKAELQDLINTMEEGFSRGVRQQTAPATDQAQFSRTTGEEATPANRTPGREYTPEQLAAFKKGKFGESEAERARSNPLKRALGNARDAIDESKQVWKTILRQGFLDQYDSFRTIINDKKAWMMANLSESSGGAIEAVLEYGHPFMNEGAVDVDVAKKSLSEVLEPLGEEVHDWLKWIAGNRAERLATEDRERLFEDVDIQALKSLNQGKMANGKSRKVVYEQVRTEFEKLNDAIVKIGVDTGIISKINQKTWKEQGFYVPFYRLAEEAEGGDVRGPYTAGGLVKQTAYKRLKGADIPLGDLLTNVIMNWNHVVSAGLKNQAATTALETAEDMELAEQVEEKNKSKDAIFIRIAGNKLWYELDQSKEGQLVLESLMSLNYNGLNNFMMKTARKFKRLLTYGVTASPEFKVANLIRDSVQAIAVADMSTQIHKNLFQGFRATKKGNPTIARMIAGGGAFGDSGYIHGSDPEALQRLIKKDIDRMTILDSPKRIQKMWDAYQDFGARLENVNRAANFEQDLSRGEVDLLTANFNARDHLDFQRTGAFVSIRALAQIVPFLNARMQGLSKLGRSAYDPAQRKQFGAVVGVYAMASILLYLYMKDDEDYEQAPQWERDTYHLFKIPGSDVMYRFPRPFEVGFMATVAERATEQMVNDKVHGELFFERLWHGLSETLSFNPIPQMVMPAVEVWANKNTFTNRQIESAGMKNLSPSERRRAWTSETAIAMSKGFDAILWDEVTLSPVQIEHLVNGYFGWIGGVTLEGIDSTVRMTGLVPSAPARRIQDYTVVGRFARTGPTRGTRYLTEFYENLRDAERAYADIRFSSQIGNEERAMKLAEKNQDVLALRKAYTQAQKAMSQINKKILMVRMEKMPADEKLAEIDSLNIMKNEIAKRIIDKTEEQNITR